MEEAILVSIVTPCLNSGKTIRKTIEAVLNQTYSNIEYWVMDGGSTDDTLAILKEYESDTRLHVVSKKDSGIYDAMNKGIAHASGKIVGIINSDDWYELDAVEHMVAGYDEDKLTFQYGMLNEYKEDKCYMTWISYHNNIDYKTVPHPTCFIDKRIYDKYGVYDTNYPICADRELMMRCVRKDDIVFVPHMHVIANFLDGGMSTNPKMERKHALELLQLNAKYDLMSEKAFKKKQFTTKVYYAIKSVIG